MLSTTYRKHAYTYHYIINTFISPLRIKKYTLDLFVFEYIFVNLNITKVNLHTIIIIKQYI